MHAHEQGGPPFGVEARAAGCTVRAFEGARPFHLEVDRGDFTAVNEWYWKFFHREEAARGLDALEDLFVPGVFRAEISPGMPLAFTASAEQSAARGTGQSGERAPRALEGIEGGAAGGRAGLDRDLGHGVGSIHRPPRRRGRLLQHHRGLPLVRRLGPRHHDFLAGARHRVGTLRRRGRHLAHLRATSSIAACCRTAFRTRARRPSTTPRMPRCGCSRRSAIISRRSATRS